MKKLSQRTVALLTCTAMVVPMALTACSGGHKGTAEKVDADSEWYTLEEIDLGTQYNAEDYDYLYQQSLGIFNGQAAFSVSGSLKMPEDVDWETVDYYDYEVSKIDFYELDGTLANSIDVQAIVKDLDVSGDYKYVNGTTIKDDGIYIDLMTYSDMSMTSDNYTVILDQATGDLISCEPAAQGALDTSNLSNEGTTSVGDCSITKYWAWSEDSEASYVLAVRDSQGQETYIDMREEFPGVEFYDIPQFIKIDDDTVIFPVSTSDSAGYTFYELELSSLTVKESDTDYSWLEDEDLYNLQYFEGIGSVVVDTNGIQKVDFDNMELSEVFSFNSCNINRSDLSYLSLVEFTDDTVILAGTVYRDQGYYSMGNLNEAKMLVLTRADSNPNAGKTILKAATLGYVSYPVSEAICQFNETNEDYFVMIDDRYSLDNFYDNSDLGDDTDWDQVSLQAQEDMNNQLAIDLMNGDGPDILLDCIGYSQLNNDDYLLDLTDYLQDTSPYFESVIEAAKTDDKLYQLPLSVSVQGIITASSNVDDDQVGFTFDQYVDFVDEVCNGEDPITGGQLYFFTMCMNAMLEEYIQGNDVDFNKDSFINLANYVNDHVNEEIDEGDMYNDIVYYGAYSEDIPEASMTELASFGSFISTYGEQASDYRVLGVPTDDGRGPGFSVYNSAAISAETPSADGCWAFIEVLLSDEIQTAIGYNWSTPVRVESFETIANSEIDGYNYQIDQYSSFYTEAEMAEYGLPSVRLDETCIDVFEGYIDSCSRIVAEDPAVTSIVREEMPAFFEGQKDLDDVITILNDRVQTFVSERG